MPAENITLIAQWEAVDDSITYELDNGTNHGDNLETYTIETADITLADATRTGYNFEGWYDAATGGNKVEKIVKGSTGEKTLYARWTPVQYSINYNLGGGDSDGANPEVTPLRVKRSP